jgi:hypothetical protein
MPIFGRHYQRGTNIPTEVVVGYNHGHQPGQDMISMDLETDFDVESVLSNHSLFLVAGTQSQWDVLENQFSGLSKRYFQFFDGDDEVITDPATGINTFAQDSYGGDESPDKFHLYFDPSISPSFPILSVAKIRMRKARAVYMDMTPSTSLRVSWQNIFADPGIPQTQNDGYGYQYILLPSKGKNSFPEYFYQGPESNPFVRIPIYPYNAIPPDVPGNTMVFVRSLYMWGENEYYYIRQIGYGGEPTPTHLYNLMLHRFEDPAEDGKPIDKKPPSDTPVESP